MPLIAFFFQNMCAGRHCRCCCVDFVSNCTPQNGDPNSLVPAYRYATRSILLTRHLLQLYRQIRWTNLLYEYGRASSGQPVLCMITRGILILRTRDRANITAVEYGPRYFGPVLYVRRPCKTQPSEPCIVASEQKVMETRPR